MDQDERVLLLSATVEELLEAIYVLKKQTDKELEKLPRVVREVLSAVPGEIRKGVQEGAGDILRDAIKPAAREAKDLAKSLKTAATEAKSSSQALRRTGIILGLFLLGGGLAVGLIGWAVMDYLVKNRTQELDQLNAEILAINQELAKTANVQSFTDKDGKASFWVEIDPTEKSGESGGKTWARMPGKSK